MNQHKENTKRKDTNSDYSEVSSGCIRQLVLGHLKINQVIFLIAKIRNRSNLPPDFYPYRPATFCHSVKVTG